MFWKKKKKAEIDVEIGEQFNDNRSAYRIAPDRGAPVILTIMGNTFYALNVSGNGVCFRSHSFPENSVIAVTLKLPSEDRIFPVTLRIVQKQGDLCRCSFEKIHEEAQNLLHAYILGLQKNKIRANQSKGIR